MATIPFQYNQMIGITQHLLLPGGTIIINSLLKDLSQVEIVMPKINEIIADIEWKPKCVDDRIMWDDNYELEEHWWWMINFFILCGQSGIILKLDKFQFCVEIAQFAGFGITNKLRPTMASFKTLLIPNEELDLSFRKSQWMQIKKELKLLV